MLTDLSDIPGLPEAIHKNRRTVATQIRVATQDRQEREDIAKMLPEGVTAATCRCVVGGVEKAFELRRYNSSRDGKTRVKVAPIR